MREEHGANQAPLFMDSLELERHLEDALRKRLTHHVQSIRPTLHPVSVSSVNRMLENSSNLSLMGHGQYGYVYRMKHSGTELAVKIMTASLYEIDDLWHNHFVEQHMHIVAHHHCPEYTTEPILVESVPNIKGNKAFMYTLQRIAKGHTLAFYNKLHPVLEVDLCHSIRTALGRAIACLHTHAGIWHGDISLQNIFYSQDDNTCTFIDFGLATYIGHPIPEHLRDYPCHDKYFTQEAFHHSFDTKFNSHNLIRRWLDWKPEFLTRPLKRCYKTDPLVALRGRFLRVKRLKIG